jgi:hypothetical protein
VTSILITSLYGCKKITHTPEPPLLSFVLLNKQNGDILKSIAKASSIKIWSMDDKGQHLYMNQFDGQAAIVVDTDSTSSFPYKFFYRTSLALKSNLGTKDWYLETNGKVDTIHYDAQQFNSNTPYQIRSILFNGQTPASNITLSGIDYYIFQRRH